MSKCSRGWGLGIGGWVACFLLAACTQYPSGGNLRLHQDMGTQPHYRPQRDPRLPVPGTVARQTSSPTPIPQPPAPILFAVYCQPCHGTRAAGDGPVAGKITRPADLLSAKYISKDDEFFYKAITEGSGLMPSLAESLSPAERRSVIAHIRKLQRP